MSGGRVDENRSHYNADGSSVAGQRHRDGPGQDDVALVVMDPAAARSCEHQVAVVVDADSPLERPFDANTDSRADVQASAHVSADVAVLRYVEVAHQHLVHGPIHERSVS
jgi:hypothetical protein